MRTTLLFFTLLLHTWVFGQKKLVEAINDFSFSFYKSISNDSTNFFISPLSLHIALGLAGEGANGSTELEIEEFLGIGNVENSSIAYEELITRTLNIEDSAYTDCQRWSLDQQVGKNDLYLANSIWINDAIDVRGSYDKLAQAHFKSEIKGFSERTLTEDNQNLNEWLKQKTMGNITEAAPLQQKTMISIINAIYFRGEWQSSFKKENTKQKKFHTIQKEKIKINYLRATSHYKYYENKDYKAVQLPYVCEQFSLLAILPHRKHDLPRIEKVIDQNKFQAILDSSYLHEVILSIPKFKIETELQPKEIIVNLGYPEMFSDAANFSGMSSTDLKIGSISHKTQIKLDENKTEAAAVTQVDMVVTAYGGGGNPPPPKKFNANHPFMFIIIDNRTAAIVFVGRFVTE